MRRAFVEALIKAAENDPRVIFLTGDLGYGVFDDFIARFGSRYVNVGIAEALLVNAAAGLAMEGFRPIVYSIASFMTARPFEQIRFTVGYPGLPVVIVGAGGGFCYSVSGISHHAPDDFALMSLIPDMTVVAPGDPNEVHALLPQILRLNGPSYIRIGKFGEPVYESPAPIELGRGRLLQAGKSVALLTTGETAPLALQAMQQLATEGIYPSLCQFHTIKPLDTSMLDHLASTTTTFICIEECLPQGGLYSGVLEWQRQTSSTVYLERLGPDDKFAFGNPNRENLRADMHFDSHAIADACRRAWHS
jgi:transketolase